MSVGDEEWCGGGVNVSRDEISPDTQQLRKWTDRENKFHAGVARRCVTFFVTYRYLLLFLRGSHTHGLLRISRIYIYIYGFEFIIETVAGEAAWNVFIVKRNGNQRFNEPVFHPPHARTGEERFAVKRFAFRPIFDWRNERPNPRRTSTGTVGRTGA